MNNATLNSGGTKRTVETGKNGVDSVYGITGMTDGTTEGEEKVVTIEEIRTLSGNMPTPTGNMYAWNQKGGVVASSTRNITGVYDLTGGCYERTTSYIANENEHLWDYGKSIAYNGNILKTASTKYTMVYPHDTDADNIDIEMNKENLNIASKANYVKNTKIYGDGIRETSTAGIGTTSWENGNTYFLGQEYTYLEQGSAYWNAEESSRFYFYRIYGGSDYGGGFRPVVIPIM